MSNILLNNRFLKKVKYIESQKQDFISGILNITN